MAKNRCASHVLQTILNYSFQILESDTEEEAENELLPLSDLLKRTISEFLPESNNLLCDPYASHIYRAILTHVTKAPDFHNFVDDFCANLIALDSEKLKALPLHSTGSPSFQILIESLSPSSIPKLIEKIFSLGTNVDEKTKQYTLKLAKSEYGSRFLEVIIKVLPKDMFMTFYSTFFRNHLLEFLKDKNANFLIQKLFQCVKNPKQFGVFIDEINSEFPNMIAKQRLGLITRITESGLCFLESQPMATNVIFEVFHTKSTSEKKHLISLLLYGKVYEDLESINFESKYNFHGCAILSAVLRYPEGQIKPFVDSLMSIQAEELHRMSENEHASRVIESFLSSHASSAAKRKIINKMFDFLPKIACNKYGSHIVELIYTSSDSELKKLIADQLILKKRELEENFYGKFVFRNCHLAEFEKEKDNFIEKLESKERKKKMFDELLNGDQFNEELETLGVEKEMKKKSKREKTKYEKDEIDDLFKKKPKTAFKESKPEKELPAENKKEKFKDLDQALGTIIKKKKSKSHTTRKFMA